MADVGPFEYFVCGSVGGICTVLVGHPLDTVKVRLQTQKTQGTHLYDGMLDCIKKTVKNEGILGLYKGMGAPMLAISPIFAFSFMGYKVFKSIFGPEKQEDFKLYHFFMAGAGSGLATLVVMAPGERIKCLLQIQTAQGGEKKYKGPIDCAIQLYKEGGLRSIYKGSAATIMRDFPSSGGYFAAYEGIKAYVTDNGKTEPTFLSTIFAGGMAGVVFWLIGLPVDVVKSRYQTAPEGKYTGAAHVFRELLAHEGPFALWTGLVPVVCRSFPANAAAFVGFEFTAGLFRRLYAYLDSSKKK